MRNESPVRLRVVIVALAGVVLSLTLIVLSQNLALAQQPPWIKPLLDSVASTLMVAATVGLIIEWVNRREFLNLLDQTKSTIAEQMRTLRALDELGLVDAYSDVNGLSFREIILAPSAFTVVMNDGKSWVGRNAGALRTRLLIPDLTTTFILQHPDAQMIDVLAHKVQQPAEFIREKIADTIRELNSFDRADTHNLIILGHDYFNVHSLFMTEDYIVFTPYLITPGRNTTPAFIFGKRGRSAQYQRWYDDIEQLKKHSTKLEVPNTVKEDVT